VNRWRAWSWPKKLLSLAGAGVLLVLLLGVVGYLVTDIPPVSQDAVSQATIIRYSNGSEIGRIGTQNRQLVPLDKVADPAQKAVLAAEDRGFYSEPGISPRGIFRALIANLKGGGVEQGGSTITQQYAKNAYLTQKRTFSRKIKEFFISLKLAHKLSKDQVLERYLNTIYFGRGASGIQVAAKTYFGRDAAHLSVAQGAVLAASIRSPAAYDPTRHPAAAKARWEYVLDGMVKKGWLTPDERAKLVYPPVLKPGEAPGAKPVSGPNGFVMDQVQAELERHGFTEAQLARGGYQVQTTIRPDAQKAAIDAVESAVPKPAAGDKNPPVGALVSIDPKTGEVWAYYGGRTAGGFDYADGGSGVQPGSSFKPYTLAAALDKGIGLGTRVDGSSPQTFGSQQVHNDAGDPTFGRIDLVTALQYSVNTAFYNLAQRVGPSAIADTAHAAGIPDSVKLYDPKDGTRPTLGITLGIYNVHVLDQAVGYGTFANGGVQAQTHFVKAVRDGKDVLYEAKAKNSRAFSADVAADATYAMQQVVNGGTGTRAKIPGRPTAGKTGTTQNNANAWFCGFTPQLATAVWIGRAQGGPLKGVLGSSSGVYGGTIPAEIFKTYMSAALQGMKVEDFPPRANVGRDSSIGGPTGAPVTASPVASPSSAPSPSPTGVSSPSPLLSPPGQQSPPPSPQQSPPPSPAASPPPASSSPAAKSSPAARTAASPAPSP
jgi:membrane peptidoglycan carboxypeptidase